MMFLNHDSIPQHLASSLTQSKHSINIWRMNDRGLSQRGCWSRPSYYWSLPGEEWELRSHSLSLDTLSLLSPEWAIDHRWPLNSALKCLLVWGPSNSLTSFQQINVMNLPFCTNSWWCLTEKYQDTKKIVSVVKIKTVSCGQCNLEPEGSATPDAVLSSSVKEIWAPRHDQGEIGPGRPTLCDHRTPCLPNLVRARSTAVLLVPNGHRPAASNDSDSFTSKKEGLHWLEKSSDLKNRIYQWFCFFLKVWALQVSTNMFWLG